jgi:outer membrane protein TolC
VRELGLDARQAAAMTLPERLPDLPASLPADAAATDDDATRTALDNRLDIRLAQARLDALAREQGMAPVARIADGLDLGIARRDETGLANEHGVELRVPLPLFDPGDAARAGARATWQAELARSAALAANATSRLRMAQGDVRDSYAVAVDFRDRIVPLHAAIVDENLRRYNGMLASVFDLLADARDQARAVQQAIAAQRDFWLARVAWESAMLGIPTMNADLPAAGTDSRELGR